MAEYLRKGILLEQYKEPALSRNLVGFYNTSTVSLLPEMDIPESERLLPDNIIRIAKQAQIVDERDGVPLYYKLAEARKSRRTSVVADAIDDEPYVSSAMAPLLQLSEQAVKGLLYAAKAVHAKSVHIAVYKNLTDLETKIPSTMMGVKVRRITGRYPAKIRSGDAFRGERVTLIGVCALIHLYRAIAEYRQQTTCFVTVAGNCVANPLNLEVSVGMTVMQLLERCGLADDPTRIITGGPMTGIAVIDPNQTLITPTTRSVLAFCEDLRNRRFTCIGCGRCTEVCPAGLAPVYLYKCIRKNNRLQLPRLQPQRCIGCGTCSYVCPAQLELSAVIYGYKQKTAAKSKARKEDEANEAILQQSAAHPE